MEAFSLLKYWRAGAGGLPPSSHTTSPAAPLTQLDNASDTDDDRGGGDDGPFFDLEFTVPPDEVSNRISEDEEDDDNLEECEREFKFTLSPNSSNDRSDPNLALSPSDNDLFFKGKLVHADPSQSSEPNSKPQFTASLLKSAAKFRAFKLGLKKPKPNTDCSNDSVPPNLKQSTETIQQPPESQSQSQKKHFTVKFKVEEVPIVSLFTRGGNSKVQNQKQNLEDSPEEKRSSKEVMNKYLKMVKPLYIRVSRRYGDKLGFSGQLSLNSGDKPAPPPPPSSVSEKKDSPAEKPQVEADSGGQNRETNGKSEKQGNLPGGLRVVCKRLGKSRSASSAVAAAPPAGLVSSKRRDDSLLQQQDAIQGAILHCKRSFNASRSESECCGEVSRSVSETCSSEVSRKSTNE